MAELQSRLQGAVGDAYRIESELGGGGMSRVFLAEDVELGRRVVIKVLPPEMSAGVNQERFRREIQLAARLQHPHVVPLLSAGSGDDLLYYMMPFIEGESLRAKLAREGELPVGEAVRILKEVIDALAYAHEHGVVHRDIKPDNVLLSGKHAVVTDFGVAKAVSASTGESSLTSLGVALGTPAYMAPEQAVADPHVDHRADIYAVGAMAYEMLTGRPPFSGPNPQAVLSAHVTDVPEPATKYRATVPDALNAVVMRCLEKKAADRWQKAEELLPHLDAILTPTGGITPTGTAPVAAVDYAAVARQSHPVRVAGLFGLASVGALAVVYLLVQQLGLPDWVFYGAIALLIIGLPITLLTGHHERQRALTMATGVALATPSSGVRRWLTWRRSLVGGGLAFAGLGVVTMGYMVMRVLGIGPAATLVTSGVLEEQERLILADFGNRTADSSLGMTVTELFRIDLAQSRAVVIMEPRQVREVLGRMDRAVNAPLTAELAKEVAEREGIKAYIEGEILPVGSGYVISARLIATASGDALAVAKESASGPDDIIEAVDGLSARLRERIGESLRTVRADPPLGRVTTSSIEALRMYAQAERIGGTSGEYERAVDLLQDAVEEDTLFAMGYRKLAAFLQNAGRGAQADTAVTRAYELRERLTERERYLVQALYAHLVEDDQQKSMNRYLTLLEKYPNDGTALNNISINYRSFGRWEDAEGVTRRRINLGWASGEVYQNLIIAQANQGRFADAAQTLRAFEEAHPGRPNIRNFAANLAAEHWDFDAAEQHFRELRDAQPNSPRWQSSTAFGLATLAEVRGKLAEHERWLRRAWRHQVGRGLWTEEERQFEEIEHKVTDALWFGEVWHGIDTTRMVGMVEDLWQRHLESQAGTEDEPGYAWFAALFAQAGDVGRGRQLLEEFTASQEEQGESTEIPDWVEVNVALREGRPLEAAAGARQLREENKGCPHCWLWFLGYAYDRAGDADSAVAIYERYLNVPSLFRLGGDSEDLPVALRRLGELYEERGDIDKAAEYYGRFVDLWQNADPELQPYVRDVRERIARLVGEP